MKREIMAAVAFAAGASSLATGCSPELPPPTVQHRTHETERSTHQPERHIHQPEKGADSGRLLHSHSGSGPSAGERLQREATRAAAAAGFDAPYARAIRKVINNTVKINTLRRYFSGVRISPDTVLTAGHGIVAQETRPLRPLNFACSEVVVSATDQSASDALKGVASMDMLLENGAERSHYADESMLKVPMPLSSGSYFPKLGPAPRPGDPVTFINYQPTTAGTLRDPLSQDDSLSRPAMVRGIELTTIGRGTQWEADIVMAGIDKRVDLDANEDTLIRNGASGGGAYIVRHGEPLLFGLSIAANLGAPARQLAAQYGVPLPSTVKPSENVQTVLVQRVDPPAVTHLASALRRAPLCHQRP